MLRRAVALCVLALAAATPASADIPSIKLTESGPEQAIDLNSSFYLTGAATRDDKDDVIAVHAIFVKAADPVLGLFGRASCDGLSHALSADPALVARSADARVGRVPMGKIWPKPPDAPKDATPDQLAAPTAAQKDYAGAKDDDAFVPAPWFKAEVATTDQKNFKILVAQPTPSFFHAGATYCMFVYRLKNRTKTVDLAPVVAILTKPIARVARKTGETDEEYANRRAAYLEEIKTRNQNFTNAINGQINKALGNAPDAPLSNPVAQAARDKVNALTGDLDRIKDLPAGVAALLDIADKLYRCTPATGSCTRKGQEPPDNYQDVNSGFGQMVAEALAAAGKLQRANDKDSPAFFIGAKARSRVKFIRLIDETQGFSVSSDSKGTDAVTVPARVKEILLPQSQILTLGDLFLLARGMIGLGKSPVPVRDSYAQLFSGVMGLQDDGTLLHTRPDPAGFVDSAARWFGELQDALYEAAETDPTTVASARQFILLGFASWFETGLGNCSADFWIQASDKGTDHCAAGSRGKIASLANVFDQGQARLKEYSVSVNSWKLLPANALQSAVSLAPISENVAHLDVSTRLDQKSWLFSYLTPVIGYARVTGTAQSFSTGFIGLQLTLWPNPINEPMWTNGLPDLKRLFGLQLALGTSSGPFGADGRNQGVDPFGLPVFVGISVQPLPYVSASIGGALMEARRSTLPQENTSLSFPFYWSLSAQINVPDLIKQLATPDKSVASANK